MSHPLFPPALNGTVEKNSYNEVMADNLVSSKFDIGPPQVRRRSTGAPVMVTMSLLLTDTQLVLFKTFYNDTLVSGSQMFEWTRPLEGTPVIMLIDPGSQPGTTPAGGLLFRVSLSLMMFENMPID